MDSRSERCETCRWWEPDRYDGFSGRCHRYPHQLSDAAVKFYTENPNHDKETDCVEQDMLCALRGMDVWFQSVTACDEFCGEWKAADAAQS